MVCPGRASETSRWGSGSGEAGRPGRRTVGRGGGPGRSARGGGNGGRGPRHVRRSGPDPVRQQRDPPERGRDECRGQSPVRPRTPDCARPLGSCEERPAAQLLTVHMSPDGGTGYAERAATDVTNIDPEGIGREAAARAKATDSAISMPAGEYPVVLEPYAVVDILDMLGYVGFSGLAVEEGRSFSEPGRRVGSDLVTIIHDGANTPGPPRTFDYEGVRKERGGLIENGRGRPTRAISAGMPGDGTFPIGNGEIVAPVRNLRFTQSYLDALAGVSAVGRELRAVRGSFGGVVGPGARTGA